MWGDVELEDEVRDWFVALPNHHQARVAWLIDLLAERGPLLDEPHTRQIDGKLRELRFSLDSVPTRITYWIAPGRRIVLLTVFSKRGRRERAEIERARRAYRRCRESHGGHDG